MKKYKVSFFAVLMMIPPEAGYANLSLLGSGTTDSLNSMRDIASNVNNSAAMQGIGEAVLSSATGIPGLGQVRTDLMNTSLENSGTIIGAVSKSKDDTEIDDDDTDVNEKLEKLEKKRDIAHGLVSGASTAMTGIGGMQMAQAISEQKSDADAEEEMGAYLTTFKCDYGKSQKYDYSTQDIILPGGNELVQYYTEYKTLADQLKADKTALGLTPGIESQVVYDKAESGLYKNAATGNTGGKYTSLSRALLDENSEDAADWAEQKDKTKKRLQIGATVAAAGLVAGFVGDKLIDKHYDKLEDQLQDSDYMFQYYIDRFGEEELRENMKKKGL
ncbi:MAG: hypothetical protein K6B71_02130 [Alphaproteobacteria bacterium]|nr:hypothetical protein [Alphaproteobacteria bacterium]